jgi:hypothetical protein
MKKIKQAACGLIYLLCCNGALAQTIAPGGRIAVGAGVGTTGVHISASAKVSRKLVLRAQGALLKFNATLNSNDVHYKGRLNFNTGGAFADWHPGENGWLLSAGAVAGSRKIKLSATPSITGSIKINGVVYPVTEVGGVTGAANFGSAAPFAGFGWDNTHYSSHHFGVRLVAGAIIGPHTPSVSLTATGPFANNASVQSNLQAEQASLTHDARDLQFYPAIEAGLNYRF